MSLKFNIDRPKVSDDEISKHQDFKTLVEKFRQQSMKQAQGDETWWKSRKVRYSTVIAGVTVVCTVSYYSLFKNTENKKHETLTTQNSKTNTSNKISARAAGPFIQPPSEKLKTRYAAYKVSNEKGGTITHPSSSKINIPKNTFVDKKGNSVVG